MLQPKTNIEQADDIIRELGIKPISARDFIFMKRNTELFKKYIFKKKRP